MVHMYVFGTDKRGSSSWLEEFKTYPNVNGTLQNPLKTEGKTLPKLKHHTTFSAAFSVVVDPLN